MRKVGTLKEIVCHPVKSMRGEFLQQAEINAFGVYGDRTHVLFMEDTEENEEKYLTIMEYPKMAAYQARFVGEAASELRYPRVEVTSPEGQTYEWTDPALLEHLAAETGRTLQQKIVPTDQPGANWEDHILITTDASLRDLERMRDAGEIDNRRFRSNLVIALDSGAPFEEESWSGKTISINGVELEYTGRCIRCFYVNCSPDTGEVDSSVLKTVVKERNSIFGVYVSVRKTGSVSVGDEVLVSD